MFGKEKKKAEEILEEVIAKKLPKFMAVTKL